MEHTIKSCLECGRQVQGRVDKKFCSDSCRSAFNNRKKSARDQIERKINSLLRQNRKILKAFYKSGIADCHQGMLRYEGFHFDFYTHIKDDKGAKIFFCYDYGYQMKNDKSVEIIAVEEHVFQEA